MSDEAAGCKKCGRAVYARHLNDAGLCSYCRPEAIERQKKAEEREQAAAEKAARELAEQRQAAAQAAAQEAPPA